MCVLNQNKAEYTVTVIKVKVILVKDEGLNVSSLEISYSIFGIILSFMALEFTRMFQVKKCESVFRKPSKYTRNIINRRHFLLKISKSHEILSEKKHSDKTASLPNCFLKKTLDFRSTSSFISTVSLSCPLCLKLADTGSSEVSLGNQTAGRLISPLLRSSGCEREMQEMHEGFYYFLAAGD